MKSLFTILLLGLFISSQAQNISQSQVRQFNAVPAYRVFGRGSGVGTPSFLQLDSNWIPQLNAKLNKNFGTQGSVLFRGATGISQDNSRFYYDSTNAVVHIVNNTAQGIAIANQNTSASGFEGINLIDENNNFVGSFAHSNTSANVLPSSTWAGARTYGTTFHIAITNDSSALHPVSPKLSITSPNGYVGINNVFPTEQLHIKGRLRVDTIPTGTATDSLAVVRNGVIYKILQSSVGSGSSSYTLPTASSTTLGGVKVGANLSIDGSGFLNAANGGTSSLWYNITDYGAVGDGVTDNTNAINAAITAASISKGVVWMPAGNFAVRSSFLDTATVITPRGIQLANGTTLVGAGSSKTVITLLPPPSNSSYNTTTYVTNAKFYSIINGLNVSNVTLRGFSVNGKLSNQINYNINPYNNQQGDSTVLGRNIVTNGISIRGGTNNVVSDIRIDSIAGYGLANFGSKNNIYSNITATTSVNGGVYFAVSSDGSILDKSLVTNNNCDNVRIRSSNITITNSEISWSKFNPDVSTANFAGVYIESSPASSVSTPDVNGIKITGNYLHDNSSMGVDANNTDTSIYTKKAWSVLVSGNTIEYNANSGVQMNYPNMMVVDNNISNNGANSNNVQDPVSYFGLGVHIHSASAFGGFVSRNTFKDTRGIQMYGISGATPSFFTATNNKQQGGTSVLGITSLNSFANETYDASGTAIADLTTVSGTLTLKPSGNAVEIGNRTATAFLALQYPNNSESWIVGKQGTNNHLAILFSNAGSYGGGAGGTNAGREIRFYDANTSTRYGGINGSGEFIWGTSGSAYSAKIRPTTTDLSTTGAQAEFIGVSGGAGTSTQSAVSANLKAGYTGANTNAALDAINNVNGTGNTISSWANVHANLGTRSLALGTATTASNVGGFLGAWSTLRNVGVIGDAGSFQTNNASALSVGVIGFAKRANASAVHIAGYFGLQNTQPTFENAALIADNAAETSPVFLARVNGTTKFSIDASGNTIAQKYQLSALNTAPTSATDTGTTGEIRITIGFIYVCIATNTWVRSALTTW